MLREVTEESRPPTKPRALVPALAGLLFAICAFLITIEVLSINKGVFLYSLDDAYIHLALGERISEGHYGINRGEYASPSSSIIWPLLLAPFANYDLYEGIPFALNLFAAALTIWIYALIVELFSQRWHWAIALGIVGALTICTNVIGLVFTGMEHSLQLLCTALLALGMIKEHRSNTLTWPLWLGLILGPLVRFENLAPSLLACLVLLFKRRYKVSIVLAGAAVAGPLAFALYLDQLGLPPLPTSVLVKSKLAGDPGGAAFYQTFLENIKIWPAPLVLVLAGYLLWGALRKHPTGTLDLWAAAVCGAHLFCGRFNWFSRYEIYAVAVGLLVLLYRLAAVRSQTSPPIFRLRSFSIIAIGALVFGALYILDTIDTPLASHDLYRQHYQLHRLRQHHWQGPLAVNDLGLVAFRTDQKVIDLIGLGSFQAYQARAKGKHYQRWLANLSEQYPDLLIAVYRKWFKPLPQSWIKVGRIVFDGRRVVAQSNEVALFVTTRTTLPEARKSLRALAAGFPKGVKYYEATSE